MNILKLYKTGLEITLVYEKISRFIPLKDFHGFIVKNTSNDEYFVSVEHGEKYWTRCGNIYKTYNEANKEFITLVDEFEKYYNNPSTIELT